MAVQNPVVGRREPEPFQPRTGGAVPGGLGNAVPGSPLASALAAATTPTQALANPSDEGSNSSGGSKLTVGPNIKLKGVEITD